MRARACGQVASIGAPPGAGLQNKKAEQKAGQEQLEAAAAKPEPEPEAAAPAPEAVTGEARGLKTQQEEVRKPALPHCRRSQRVSSGRAPRNLGNWF